MSSKLKIYTKTGDRGQTSLYGGKRVSKSDQRVIAYGSIDEINSTLGMVISKTNDQRVREFLEGIQIDLFLIGANLAGAKQELNSLEAKTEEIEKFIDTLDKDLPELKNFILPGGSEAGATVNFARSVARRAEREVIKLGQTEQVDNTVVKYLNRLSDLLFIVGRYLNSLEGKKETIWKGK
ncbi:cob(I)yrinic acid a,c-diamide adenosyltransferase [Candidatus Gottesmanbacteria bacterium]|nr:cob(I)yrinic acid a,c-diamide adenosyltransferase [Candidatus Gottesmanbacteria bacterium]